MKKSRISVAVLAPVWQVGDERLTVGIMNKASLAKGRKSASAFGGAVTLDRVEMTVVRHLGGAPEREGSFDARLICDESDVEQLIAWFKELSIQRLTKELRREIEEEAIIEGAPVFPREMLYRLKLEYVRLEEPDFGIDELRSVKAEEYQTRYLWNHFRVIAPPQIKDHLLSSERIVLPTADDLSKRMCGDVRLSPTLR